MNTFRPCVSNARFSATAQNSRQPDRYDKTKSVDLKRYTPGQKFKFSKSKVSDLSRGWPEGFLFNSYYTEV